MKKILITGAGGFVGSRILQQWQGKYELCALPKGFFCTADEALTRAQVEALHPDVILHTAGQPADEQSMREAAQLAAYYSRARESQNVPVDYTPVRYVKKPAGAKPGMVIYTTYRTVYVTPEESQVKTLREE